MLVGVPKELKEGEKRVALTPDAVKQLIAKGFRVLIEQGAGLASYSKDEDYLAVNAEIAPDKHAVYSQADVVLKVNAPQADEIALMKQGASLLCFMYAHSNQTLVDELKAHKINGFSVDAIPRISRAQKMDALSSQANLAGYKAVLLGANALGKIFPMLMTAAGTVKPSKVVIFGAGVAGLQALATAKRLGAIVEVTDIRPETKEQILSLGGKFIEVAADSSIKTEGGYVKDVSADFLRKQQETVARHVADADIVITTALIPGKKAPLLVTADMVKAMRLGSVIVDMAVEQGGNCELSEAGKTVVKQGVTIIGEPNLPSLLPQNASQLYAKNISDFLTHLATKDGFIFDLEEEITKASLVNKA